MAEDTGPAADLRPRGGRRLSGWSWVALVLAVVATIGVSGVVDWIVMWGQSSTCYDQPDPSDVRHGRIALAAVLAVVLTPWVLGTVMSAHRVAVGVAGAMAITPALLLFLDGFRTEAWVGGFCF